VRDSWILGSYAEDERAYRESIPTTDGGVETRVKPTRRAWKQAEVAVLVTAFHKGDMAPRLDRSAAEAEAKLIELGLLSKPEKTAITQDDIEGVDQVIRSMFEYDEARRVLVARYLIKRLGELLPKRVKRDEDVDGVHSAGFLKP
jgi:hypothetical protein